MDLLVIGPVFFLSRKLDFTDPNVLLRMRVLFFASVAAIGAVLIYIYMRIKALKDVTIIKVTKAQPWGSQEPEEQQEMTVYDYDMEELGSYVKSWLIGIGISLVLQFQFQIYPSMVYQTFTTPWNLYKNGLFKIHILGMRPLGDLKRPFPKKSMLSMFMPQAPAADDRNDELENQDDGALEMRETDNGTGKARFEEIEDEPEVAADTPKDKDV